MSGRWTITKQFEFSAAHHLPHLPEGHKCRRPHGHNYVVTVEIGANQLTGDGFVIDFAELDFMKLLIDDGLDHRDLNEEMTGLNGQTTSERIAENLADFTASFLRVRYPETEIAARGLSIAVTISETPKTASRYERPL